MFQSCLLIENEALGNFLKTNSFAFIIFRSFGLLAVRNILRSMFGLSVVYTSRWTHPLGKSSQDVILVHSTKVSFLLSTRHLYITSAVGLLCGGELPRIPIFSSKLSFLVYLHLNATKEL